MTRRRLLATLAATLGLDAAARAWGNPAAAVLLALAAVWLPCTLVVALVTTRSTR